MPRRELLSPAERQQLTCLPNDRREIEAHYTLTPADRELVAARRGDHNRLGFAVQLCFLRHPGWVWTPQEKVPAAMLRFIASQVGAALDDLATYAQRDETRREHLAELQQTYGWQSGTARTYRELSAWLTEQARGTDNGMALMANLIGECRRRRLVVPPLSVLERLAIASRSRARAAAYQGLTGMARG